MLIHDDAGQNKQENLENLVYFQKNGNKSKQEKESVTHSWVFEMIDIPPKGLNNQSYVSQNSEDSINCDDQRIKLINTLDLPDNFSIILVGKGFAVDAT